MSAARLPEGACSPRGRRSAQGLHERIASRRRSAGCRRPAARCAMRLTPIAPPPAERDHPAAWAAPRRRCEERAAPMLQAHLAHAAVGHGRLVAALRDAGRCQGPGSPGYGVRRWPRASALVFLHRSAWMMAGPSREAGAARGDGCGGTCRPHLHPQRCACRWGTRRGASPGLRPMRPNAASRHWPRARPNRRRCWLRGRCLHPLPHPHPRRPPRLPPTWRRAWWPPPHRLPQSAAVALAAPASTAIEVAQPGSNLVQPRSAASTSWW